MTTSPAKKHSDDRTKKCVEMNKDGDTNMDGELEALVLGASIKLTTGFTGARAN